MTQPDPKTASQHTSDDTLAPGPAPETPDLAHPELEPSYTSLRLAKPKVWSRRMAMVGLGLVGALIGFNEAILSILQAPQASPRMLALILAPPALFVAWVVWRLWDTPKQPRTIEFGTDAVSLPLHKNTKRSVSLKYADTQGVIPLARAQSTAVLIDTGELTLGYEDADFDQAHQPEASRKLSEELNRRIRALPEHAAVTKRMRARFRLGHAASSRPTPITRAIMGLVGVYFAIELLSGALDQPFGLLRLGASAPALIEDGQYWRLISANFLHGGWVHLLFNGMALYFLGMAVEKLLGSWRFTLIYLTSAIAGAAASWLLGPGAMSVGSSTAIFGLIGAFLAIHLRYWSQLPPPFRQSKQWWVVIIALNGGLPFIWPAIDYAAHMGGIAVGLLLTLFLLRSAPTLDPERPTSSVLRTLAGGVSALTAAGLIFGGIYALDPHPRDAEKVYDRLYEQALAAPNAPEQINEISWMIATDPTSEKPRVLQARDALEHITDVQTGRVELRDTLATLEYRLARLSSEKTRIAAVDRAIAIEIALLDEPLGDQVDDSLRAFFGAQLARFLDYRRVIGEPVDPDELLGGALEIKVDDAEQMIHFKGLGDLSQDVAVYLLATRDDELYGVLRGCLERGVYPQRGPSYAAASIYEALDEDATLRFAPALVQKDTNCSAESDASRRQTPDFWPLTPEVRAYP